MSLEDHTIAEGARWIIRKFRSSRTKTLIPASIYNVLYKVVIIPLVRTYSYAEYLEYQKGHSAWTRQAEKARHSLELATQEMSPWFSREMLILDLGCGDGYLLDLVRPYVSLAVGVDYNFEKLVTSFKHGNASIQCDIHHLPFANEAFDVVHSSHVLEHLIDPTNALEELYRILKPNGHLLVVVPIGGSPNLKHPNTYSHESDIYRKLGKGFTLLRVWRENIREPEFWVVAKRN